MSQAEIQSKVYLDVVEKLKEIIDEQQLRTGDKLPSERDLAVQLNVGRSSVREAFRALELLGLIETRRGEGTFIADFRNHRLVEILSGFILRNDVAKNDVLDMVNLIEIGSLYTLMEKNIQLELEKWKNRDINGYDFFKYIIESTENRLQLKIWRILSKFAQSLSILQHSNYERDYLDLIEAVNARNKDKAFLYYRKIVNVER
ncbi:FadR/GntR family transcriptional regulator [Bacillus kwashiorkori]|uniref:FadR/GntR family transcriptional regulator n=1 Tax=Bacillus kwashiorkori TaxID=1522318 RepID=UPI000780AA51|nr:GntR family transcriptional regulator [Bacillus kwashiorkori]